MVMLQIPEELQLGIEAKHRVFQCEKLPEHIMNLLLLVQLLLHSHSS